MPIPNEGMSSNWTLRFKHGRHTILIYSDPLTPFATLKTELLTVLRERYPSGLPSGKAGERLAIPDAIEDVALAILRDRNDPTRGWQVLKLPGRGEGLRSTPKAVGLRDVGVVAFRFMSQDEQGREQEQEDGEDEGGMDVEGDEEDGESQSRGEGGKFVVEWPSFDDVNPVSDAMDQD